MAFRAAGSDCRPKSVSGVSTSPGATAAVVYTDAARPDAVGYLLVRSFRIEALKQLFAPLAGMLEAQGSKLSDLKMVPETPGWALIQAARPDTLPAAFKSWPELLQRAVLDSRKELLGKYGSLAAATWGADNPTSMGDHRHGPAISAAFRIGACRDPRRREDRARCRPRRR